MVLKQQIASCECMSTAIVDVLFNLIPRSSNTDAWRWPPTWRSAPNIKPKLWYLSVSGIKTQQSAILHQSRIRNFGDRCTYQQAVNQQFFFSKVHFFGRENKPWNFILQAESGRRASLFVHHFEKSIISWSCISVVCFPDLFRVFWILGPACRSQAKAAGSSLSLFDWQIHNNLTKTMLFTGLAAKIHCQSGFATSTAGFYRTSAETSHSEHMPEVTESWYSQRNLGKQGRC